MPFHAPWLLLGLATLAIPPLIHLLNRRRYDVVDWGAMQLLQVSDASRRRVWLEELLLMLARMAALALLCLALAGPFVEARLPSGLAGRPGRDVALVLDASASMTAEDEEGVSAFARAVAWAEALLDRAQPGDGVTLVLARGQAVPVTGGLTADVARARRLLQSHPRPGGSCNWVEAVRAAYKDLASGQNGQREVYLISDGQAFGMGDAESLFRWELLAAELGLSTPPGPGPPRPRLTYVDASGKREGSVPNYALGPLTASRTVAAAGREVRFRTSLILSGQDAYTPPHRVRLEVDGKHVRDLPPPQGPSAPRDGRIPLTFTHRFAEPGSHVVSVVLEADPPPAERPAGFVRRDWAPGDNRQDLAAEVVEALPVLIVDGEPSSRAPPVLGSRYLRDALSPARDPQPAVRARVVTAGAFTPEMLTASPAPRAVVLHDVRRLTAEQADAVGEYLASGGGVLVALGERADAEWYNAALYRGGTGWLAARLDGLEGEEGKWKESARPEGPLTHPALSAFGDATLGGLADARFCRWWKLTTAGMGAAGAPGGFLTSPRGKFPLLVERPLEAGRAVVLAVPLDGSWGSNLPELPCFVPLAHELVSYLAGARGAERNLTAGQPIRFPIEGDPSEYALTTPDGEERRLALPPAEPPAAQVQRTEGPGGPWYSFAATSESGVYTLRGPGGKVTRFVVQTDPREPDLTPLSGEAKERLTRMVGLRFTRPEDGPDGLDDEEAVGRQDLGVYLLMALTALLCLEVWMTRRLVMSRG
jgi:hypothetical protein